MDTTQTSKRQILVVGSSNTDMVIKAAHLPRPGETILGGTFHPKSFHPDEANERPL